MPMHLNCKELTGFTNRNLYKIYVLYRVIISYTEKKINGNNDYKYDSSLK